MPQNGDGCLSLEELMAHSKFIATKLRLQWRVENCHPAFPLGKKVSAAQVPLISDLIEGHTREEAEQQKREEAEQQKREEQKNEDSETEEEEEEEETEEPEESENQKYAKPKIVVQAEAPQAAQPHSSLTAST